MKLTSANVNVTNSVSVARLTVGNAFVSDQTISLGAVTVNTSQVTVGNVSITPTSISTPQLVISSSLFGGGLFAGITDYQEFTANGTWYNPLANASVNASLTGYEQVLVMAWGGGGAGRTGAAAAGGGGGACVVVNKLLSECDAVCNVVVGVGGVNALAVTGSGGNSIFYSNSTTVITAYGGYFGNTLNGGGGGGWIGPGTIAGPGGPLGGTATSTISTFGGGYGANTSAGLPGGNSVYGGAGGGKGSTAGGYSIFGGAGGRASNGPVSTSIFGGSGANSTVAATAPGGGGDGVLLPDGARGEVRVWVMGPGGTTLGAPTYSLTSNTTSLYEGSSALFTISTTNIPNGTTLYYTLNNSSTAVSSDFTGAVNGSVLISGGVGTFTLTAADDADSANEAFQIDVRTNSTTGTIVASNGSVSIIPGISFVGANNANASSITLPAHQTGDMIIIYATSVNGTGLPTLAAGYTSIDTFYVDGDINSDGNIVGYKIASSNSETSGTWTSANVISAVVYRNVSAIGNTVIGTSGRGNQSTIEWLSLNLDNTDNSSWVVGFGVTEHKPNTVIAPPSSRISRVATTGSIIWDSNTEVSSYTSQTTAIASQKSMSHVLELKII